MSDVKAFNSKTGHLITFRGNTLAVLLTYDYEGENVVIQIGPYNPTENIFVVNLTRGYGLASMLRDPNRWIPELLASVNREFETIFGPFTNEDEDGEMSPFEQFLKIYKEFVVFTPSKGFTLKEVPADRIPK